MSMYIETNYIRDHKNPLLVDPLILKQIIAEAMLEIYCLA